MNTIENNRDNKEKFYTQYWGQKILQIDTEVRKVDGFWIYEAFEYPKHQLLLTPLQAISDEDATRVAELWTTQTFYKIRLQKTVANCFEEKMYEMPYTVSDYLRSKGYALPYLNLSVDDMVKFGWITLKD